ncbi:MAG: rhamnan synthesis protein F [Clostridiales bacterium]|nr:MAG: rhamnan synthesis protein F [Clostridiales bacterium]
MQRVGVFLFYDKDGIVDGYIDHYLKELRKVTEYLVVVVNGKLTPEGREKFSKLSDDFFVRENVGYDVWAYHDALDYIGWDELKKYDELILANYTLFGPFYPLSEAFAAMEDKKCDWWGLHRRYENRSITTYFGKPLKYGYLPEVTLSNFWVIRKKLLHSYEFWHYWANIPPISSYIDACLYHEPTFTMTMCDAGYTFDTFDGESQRGVYRTPTIQGAYDQISRLKVPFVRKKAFYDPNGTLDLASDVPQQIFKYLAEHTEYDCDLIWENLLRTVNQYDLKNWLNLNQILPMDYSVAKPAHTAIAVIFHAFYIDIMERYLHNIAAFPEGTDFFFTTDTEEKKAELQKLLLPYENRFQITYSLVENRGRDVSALLIGCRDVVLSKKYDLICFMHDKKGLGSQSAYTYIGQSFSDCCFENIAPTADYVNNVVDLFNRQTKLGIAVPPPPKNADYYKIIGGSWASDANYPNVQKLLSQLNISVPLDPQKPPVAPYGTVFWFRPNALLPLFEREWRYTDFPVEPSANDGELPQAIERAYSLIAQGRGYYPSVVMSSSYAEQEVTRMTEIAHTYVDLTMKHVGCYHFLHIATNQFSKVLDAQSMPIAVPQKSPNVLKRVVKACLPRFLWEFLRKIRCRIKGWTYIPEN